MNAISIDRRVGLWYRSRHRACMGVRSSSLLSRVVWGIYDKPSRSTLHLRCQLLRTNKDNVCSIRASRLFLIAKCAKLPVNTASCNTVVYSAQQVASGYTYYWQQRPCCGTNVYLPYYNLGGCLSAELKSPEIRERLFKRAQKEDVLVASCDGYLRLLPHLAMTSSPVPPPASKPMRPSLMGDQIYIPTLDRVSGGLSR